MAMVQGNKGAASQINVTPLIDVLLVLLIIFMMIVPAKPNGLETQVPQPPKSDSVSGSSNAIVVQVRALSPKQPTYRINSADLPKDALQPRLKEVLATRQDKLMFVQGDPSLPYEAITEVVDIGRRAGAVQIAMLTPGTQAAR